MGFKHLLVAAAAVATMASGAASAAQVEYTVGTGLNNKKQDKNKALVERIFHKSLIFVKNSKKLALFTKRSQKMLSELLTKHL